MGREEGGGFRMGNTCIPVADSFRYMAKPIQYCKVKNKIKLKKKKKKEMDMEQQTDSKSGKEYIKAVYCHPAYLTSMQSVSCKIPGWMKHKLE